MKISKAMLQSAYNDFCDAVNPAMLQYLIDGKNKLTEQESAVAALYYAAIKNGSPPTDEMFDSAIKALNNN